MVIRKVATAALTGLLIGASMTATALAAPDQPGVGAAACQPEQGQIVTATAARSGQLGGIISGQLTGVRLAPINGLNEQALFACKTSQAQQQP
jgi:hypothetical protein